MLPAMSEWINWTSHPRTAIHHPPAFAGILASIDALLLYDGVHGIRLRVWAQP